MKRWERDAGSRQREEQAQRPRGESDSGVLEGPMAIYLAGGRDERGA